MNIKLLILQLTFDDMEKTSEIIELSETMADLIVLMDFHLIRKNHSKIFVNN